MKKKIKTNETFQVCIVEINAIYNEEDDFDGHA